MTSLWQGETGPMTRLNLDRIGCCCGRHSHSQRHRAHDQEVAKQAKDELMLALCAFVLTRYNHVLTNLDLDPYLKEETSL